MRPDILIPENRFREFLAQEKRLADIEDERKRELQLAEWANEVGRGVIILRTADGLIANCIPSIDIHRLYQYKRICQTELRSITAVTASDTNISVRIYNRTEQLIKGVPVFQEQLPK